MGNINITKMFYNYFFKPKDIIIKTINVKKINKIIDTNCISVFIDIDYDNDYIINNIKSIDDINVYYLSILCNNNKQHNLSFYQDGILNIQQNIYFFTLIIKLLTYVKELDNNKQYIFTHNYITFNNNKINFNIELFCKHIIYNKNIIFSIEIHQIGFYLHNLLKNMYNDSYNIINLDKLDNISMININYIVNNLIINIYNIILYNYLNFYYINYYREVKLEYININNNKFEIECNRIIQLNNIKCNVCDNISYFNYSYNILPNFCIDHKTNNMKFLNLDLININHFITDLPLLNQSKFLNDKLIQKINLSDINDSNLCIICSTNYKNIITFPCMHLLICDICENNSRSKSCIVCNTKKTNIFKLYL